MRLKTIALPVEHGGWAFVLEPVVLGVCLAPTLAGAFLGAAVVAAFLARQPLKIIAADRRHGRRSKRTLVGECLFCAYSAVGVMAFVVALKSSAYSFILPLLIAAPFALAQLISDARGRSRSQPGELSGATAMAAVAAAITLTAGWSITSALSLWAVLAAIRIVPSIIYVRTRLRKNRGSASLVPALATHVLSCVLVISFWRIGLAPWLAVAAAGLLLLRAGFFLSSPWPRTSARGLGLSEVAFGLVVVMALVIGYKFQ